MVTSPRRAERATEVPACRGPKPLAVDSGRGQIDLVATHAAAHQDVLPGGPEARLLVPGGHRLHRHPGDLIRVGIGMGVLCAGVLIAKRGELPVLERDLFRLINDLPTALLPALWLVMQLGNAAAIPVTAALAAALRRFAMARDLLISGGLAYFGAILVKDLVGRERPAGLPVGAILHEAPLTGLGFVSGHSAVAAAIATAAAPYLARRPRRALWALALTVPVARIYMGAHLPLDVVAGAALGWAVGSMVHWVFGVPRWEPRPGAVVALLRRFGLAVHDLRPAGVAARSSHPYRAVSADGEPLFVKILDPDPFDRDWLFRAARFLATHDVKDADAFAPLGQQAEHEAAAALAAWRQGIRVPQIVLARGVGGWAVIAQQCVDGRPVDSLEAAALDHALLSRIWAQVARLREARIAHRDLVASNVLVDGSGLPWLVDFGNAEVGASDAALAGDVAELLASLGRCASLPLLVSTAVEGLGPEAVRRSLHLLAPLALSRVTREQLRERPGSLTALVDELRRQLRLPAEERVTPTRRSVGAASAVWVAAGAVLIGMPVAAGARSVLETMELNGWRWIGAAVIAALAALVAAAVVTERALGSRIAVARVIRCRLAYAASGLPNGRRAGRHAALRGLARSGVPMADADRALSVASAATGIATGVVGLACTSAWLVQGIGAWHWPELPAVLPALAGSAVLLVGAARLSAGRVERLADERTGAALRRGLPRGLRGRALVPVWAAASVILETLAFLAALNGVGSTVPALSGAVVYLAVRTAAAAVPLIDLPGVAELALLAGIRAAGDPLAIACAGVLIARLLTFWLPTVLGGMLAWRERGPLP
jgi:undecaprenyl-diphosphatase